MSGVKAFLQLCWDLKDLTLAFDATKLHSSLIPENLPTPSLRHGLKDRDIFVSRLTSILGCIGPGGRCSELGVPRHVECQVPAREVVP